KKQKVFVYEKGQGLVQVQDKKAIADAQKEYDDVQNEIKKAEIDKQIGALEKQNEELDKQIDGWNEYKDQFSNMENDVQDTLTVEQAKKALGTDEKGLLSLDEKTINGIRDGLAEAVYKKDVEDNKDNEKYVEVSMDNFLKSLGATVSWAEFKEIANNIMGTVPAVTPLSNIGGSSNTTNVSNSSIVNNKPVNINSNITINEASDPVETANVVQNYMKNLLTQTINSTK
ncbi:MAG: hypothetical protein J6A19_05640, partial [Oscillospiraceae bacterium]|nr:hypothetical protein [Oscillospiraceae bacterium]